MSSCRRMLATLGASVLGLAIFMSFALAPLAAQKQDKKPDKAQQMEAQALNDVLDQAMAGRATPADVPITIESYHFFKSSSAATYVPFTMVVDAAKLSNSNVSFLFRVVNKNAKPVEKKETKPPVDLTSDKSAEDISDLREQLEAERARLEAEKNKLPPLPEAAWQDMFFLDLKSKGPQARIPRSFQTEPGDYTIYIAMKERGGDKKKPAKVTVFKREMTIPNMNLELGVSSMLLLARTEQLATPLTPDQMRERPYAIGGLEIVPALGTKFAKNQELHVYYQIYNAGATAENKPNVLIEYNFYQKPEGAPEKFFNKTEPFALNAQSLPAAFDITKHTLFDYQSIPLASFPVGEYRLNVKITDKVSNKTLSKDLTFTVTE